MLLHLLPVLAVPRPLLLPGAGRAQLGRGGRTLALGGGGGRGAAPLGAAGGQDTLHLGWWCDGGLLTVQYAALCSVLTLQCLLFTSVSWTHCSPSPHCSPHCSGPQLCCWQTSQQQQQQCSVSPVFAGASNIKQLQAGDKLRTNFNGCKRRQVGVVLISMSCKSS